MRSAAPTAIASSINAAGRSLPNDAAIRVRRALPPSVPTTAPAMPSTPPTTHLPALLPIVAPLSAPSRTRAANCGGTLRLGVVGS